MSSDGVEESDPDASTEPAQSDQATLKDALGWLKRFVVTAITIAVVALAVVGVLELTFSSQIKRTVTAHNTALAQTLGAVCIVLQSNPSLEPLVPKECAPLSPHYKALVKDAEARTAKAQATIAAEDAELTQVLRTACILINSDADLKPFAPAACKGVKAP